MTDSVVGEAARLRPHEVQRPATEVMTAACIARRIIRAHDGSCSGPRWPCCCAPRSRPAPRCRRRPGGDAPPVLLVSIDGFRADYLDRGITPNLSRIANTGVRADGMRPSYPALTFPNHYTLVTGLRPDRHGIVHNTMRDPATRRLSKPTTKRRRGRRALVERRGADLGHGGDARPADGDDVLARFAGADPRRAADALACSTTRRCPMQRASTRSSNGSPNPRRAFASRRCTSNCSTRRATTTARIRREMPRSIAQIDASIGRLLDALQARGLRDRVNLVIVSDHGMAEVAAGPRGRDRGHGGVRAMRRWCRPGRSSASRRNRARGRGGSDSCSVATRTTNAGERSRTAAALAFRHASARAADRVPDGRRLGCDPARRRRAATRACARFARLRSGIAVDARVVHRATARRSCRACACRCSTTSTCIRCSHACSRLPPGEHDGSADVFTPALR